MFLINVGAASSNHLNPVCGRLHHLHVCQMHGRPCPHALWRRLRRRYSSDALAHPQRLLVECCAEITRLESACAEQRLARWRSRLQQSFSAACKWVRGPPSAPPPAVRLSSQDAPSTCPTESLQYLREH